MKVLDKGEVILIDSMASDLSVVRAARVSNGILTEKADPERDEKLINYLMKHRHGTPFEHNAFTFYIKCPLFVAREWQRHRIGSFNEVSGRYVTFEPEFYVPTEYRVPAESNKQGSVFPSGDQVDWNDFNRGEVGKAVTDAYNAYLSLRMAGVANEMARIILPLALYTQFYWTVNARSLMNFLSLRTAEDAQWEIRQYGHVIGAMFAEHMPMTFNAWLKNDKLAP